MKIKTLQEQIDKFYEETGYQLEVKDGKPYYDDDLSLYNKEITKLPDNLIVEGTLDLTYTEIAELSNSLVVGGSLYLKGSKITQLPDNLVVGGWLDLEGSKITKLPENLVVGSCLDLKGTNITELPNSLIVGCYLNLCRTKLVKLPDNLVVDGYLDLEGTKITELPDNLVVGGGLDLSGTKITRLPKNLIVGGLITDVSGIRFRLTLTNEAKKKLQKIKNFLQWNVGGETYIKADSIFSVVDSHRGNVWRTHRIGKNETLYVVTDGEDHYAHGNTLKEAKTDLIYKINDRDTSLYETFSLDDEVSFEEAIAMYRTITGACDAGTRNFVENRLPEPHKEKYTIREVIDLTDGEYGSERLKEFFKISER